MIFSQFTGHTVLAEAVLEDTLLCSATCQILVPTPGTVAARDLVPPKEVGIMVQGEGQKIVDMAE